MEPSGENSIAVQVTPSSSSSNDSSIFVAKIEDDLIPLDKSSGDDVSFAGAAGLPLSSNVLQSSAKMALARAILKGTIAVSAIMLCSYPDESA